MSTNTHSLISMAAINRVLAALDERRRHCGLSNTELVQQLEYTAARLGLQHAFGPIDTNNHPYVQAIGDARKDIAQAITAKKSDVLSASVPSSTALPPKAHDAARHWLQTANYAQLQLRELQDAMTALTVHIGLWYELTPCTTGNWVRSEFEPFKQMLSGARDELFSRLQAATSS
jgi:hypothetical protein